MLLLGGGGQLGLALRAHWPQPGDLCVQSGSGGAGVLRFDPLDVAAMRDAAADARAIICLAGVTDARAARTGYSLSLNSDLAVAAVTASMGARVFIASSAAVYGAAGGVHDEDDAVSPLSAYGKAKLDMEVNALAQGRNRAVPVCALRIGNVAGADAILGGWHDRMQIDQFADGTTPARSYIGPVSFARALHALTLADDLPAILNIATPGTVFMGDLLACAGLAWQSRPAPPEAIAEVALDVSRLSRYVDFAPVDSTAAGMVAEWRKTRGGT